MKNSTQNEKRYKVKNENGTFTGNELYNVMEASKCEFSKSYTIYVNENDEWILFDKVNRDINRHGKIIR